ncbi:uncharacterized protein LOC101891538 [Musca domestica]|nr:uncharacterized protein LOC101891538 [Musca domestica]
MNSLLEICQAINEINDNFTMEDVKKKIHTLRSQFLKELREFLDSKQDDVANQIMKPKLWCFDKLKFLKDHCSLKRSTTLEFEDSNALDTDPEFEELRENVLHEYEIEEMSRVASETSEEIIEEYCASDDLEEFDAQKYILWTKDMVEYLINRYRQHENLYNTKNPYYMDRPKRFNSMLAICKELKRYNQNLTVDDVKKKIHTLRSQYVKELRDIYLSQRDVVEPKLWCFEQMEFLKPYCRMKRKFSNNTIEKAAKYSPLNSSESNAEAYSECETPYELDQSTANRMWNRHLVQLLISKYRRHEHLYNTNNPQYLDREARLKSLQDIAKSLQRINANITIYHIKKKIHTLRTQYLKELRELQENAVGKATAPKLWCYRQLAFLEPHCVIKNSTANSNEVEMELVSNDPIGADEAHDINTFYLDYEEINEEFDLHEDNTLDKQDVLWTREMLELLIQKYQQHENLYNKTHAHYNNATKNLKSFRDICKSTKKLNPDITEEDVKNEINNLKRQYVEDLKRLEGRRDLKPKLWCFEQFAFLRPYCDDQRKYNLDDLEMQETDGNENAAYIECEKPIKDGKEHQTSKEILRYLRCGEILIASSCDYKDPYILKCDHCGDVYSAVDSFLNHCIYHFQLGEKNEIGLKENSCREQKSGCNEVNGATNELYSVEIAVDKFENPEMDEEGQDDDEHVEESQFNDLEDFEPLEYDPYVTEEFSVDEECQAYEGEDPLDLYGEEIESQFDEEEDYTMFSEQLHSKDPAELSSYDDQEYLYDEHIENVQTQNYTPVFVLNFIKSEKNLLAFIKAYHKQPYLWRRHHTDQIQRRNSPIYLQKIATELREHHHLSLNVKEVTMLIRHVRGQYRILLNPRTMAGEYKAKSTKTLTTRCARALEFLQPFMEISSISRLNEKHSNLSSRQIVQLLRIYQQFPNLWNTNRIEYVCRNKRQESLVAMQRQIKLKMDWATTLSDLRRYLYGLHIQCSREKSCSGKICKYYEHMAFLVDHVAPFKCSLCKRKFKSPFVLKIHHNEHAGDLHLLPPLQCNICQKNFNDFKLYKLHAQRHMDDLQEECTVCGKRFGKPFELRKHQQTHTNETPFCCELCGVAYRHNSSLIAHMRKHRSELCYKCNRCSKRFQSNVQLHEHMKTHQRNTITYDCDMCEKSFKSKETLNAHRASHLRKNEKCTICGEFFGESSLRKHMQGHLENGEVDDNMEGEDFIITIDSEKIHGF